MKRSTKTITTGILACGLALGCVGCGDTAKIYNNDSDPLVFSTLAVDKVFNPFYSTSGTDSAVVELTQLPMISSDKDGKPVCGDNEACVVKDYEIVTTGTENVDQKTTYYFVLKNNVKFSDGSALTMKDVLFNLYVYLDLAYTGASTIYSTDIVGLKEYRTQKDSEKEQDSFMEQFQAKATDRINALLNAIQEIRDEHGDEDISGEELKEYLKGKVSTVGNRENLVEDYEKTVSLFEEELESDYSAAKDTYSDISFTDQNGKLYKGLFTTDVEAFLYNEGFITWSKKDGKLRSSFTTDSEVSTLKSWTQERAIKAVLDAKIPDDIEEILQYWNTSVTLSTFIANAEMEDYFKDAEKRYPNISGIKFANGGANRGGDSSVTVNDVNYGEPTYDSEGAVISGNEVLSITINGVDPKAIWNFSFAVAPMYYYSDQEHIDKFNYTTEFGVQYNSQTFMEKVVKNPDKIGVPVGAGPYMASKSSGGTSNISAGDFYEGSMIYYERNDHFIMGPAKIRKVRYKVVSATQMLNELYTEEVDFAEPSAKPETVDEIKKKSGFEGKSITTLGYGYIGVNASKVIDLNVRKAIMYSINTQLCVQYYKTAATAIHRSMSTSSWAYPKGCTAYYPYIGGPVPANLNVVDPLYREFVQKKNKKANDTFTQAEQEEFIQWIMEEAGYRLNGNGVYQKGSHVCKYTFTVAGEERDHPAWQALYSAGEFLNKIGFQINTTPDSRALQKLATGDLAVWAAAWGSTIDPDMYQVYHKDSTASSVKSWGYPTILRNAGGRYNTENEILDTLSEYIELARQTNDQDRRAEIYSEALDLVMQLAIELPSYQRDDLFAYNNRKIDASSLTPDKDLSSYKGLTSDLHYVSLITEK